VLSLVLLAAFVAEEVGLSLATVAFLVGMIVGESEFRHQVDEEIRPFRDLLLARSSSPWASRWIRGQSLPIRLSS
jgi:Kef-type K+ transport system membrane component KefB